MPTHCALDLPQLLAQQSRARGAATALSAPGRPGLSFAELCGSAAAMADALRDVGIGQGDVVATVLGNGPAAATAFLGTASAAACAPIDPALTVRELADRLATLRPGLVLVPVEGSATARRAASELGVPLLDVESDPEVAGSARLLPRAVTLPTRRRRVPGNVALVLHTSGTTARPRLVPLTRRNVIAAAAATCRAYGLSVDDHRLNVMPLFHVQGLVGCVVACLVAGSTVLCAGGFDAARTLEWLVGHRTTWFSATPTMHLELLRAARVAHTSLDGLGLRFIRTGAAALPGAVRARLEEGFRVPVVESYGMTEAHQIASTPLPPDRHRPGTVGRPTGSDVSIVDGEILVRGENVIGGYLDAGLSERACFIDGWFRTGDLGHLDESGYLTISGRLKDVINRGGEKIAPREVEEALGSHPSVMEAVAFPVPHPSLQEEVAAAVVLAPGRAATESELRSFSRGRLAAFKVPGRIVVTDRLPTNATGKLQRRTMAEQLGVTARAAAAEPVDGPSPTEQVLTGLWQSALGVPAVGLDDDFFFLGGDSLTGTRLLGAVREVFQVDIPALTMYDEAGTVRSMAALIHRLRELERS